jgi:hypothetical protein
MRRKGDVKVKSPNVPWARLLVEKRNGSKSIADRHMERYKPNTGSR